MPAGCPLCRTATLQGRQGEVGVEGVGMSRFGWGALVALAVAAPACSCDERVVFEDGQAVVTPASLDFGRVALGGSAGRDFKIRNAGRAQLAIEDVRIAGLGVDMELVNQGPSALAPGEETTLTLRFAPIVEGILERALLVRVDDRTTPRVQLPVTGVALRPRILVEPLDLDFGRIEVGEAEFRTVVLRNDYSLPVELSLGQLGDEQFATGTSRALGVPPGSVVELDVAFRPVRTGRAQGALTLTPCAICDPILVSMRGQGIDRAILVAPPELDFGNVPIDRRGERAVTITNVGSRPLQLFSIEVDGRSPAFHATTLPATLAEHEQLRIPVTFLPTRLGADRGSLRIRSSSARAPLVIVGLRGIGGGPEIAVVPGELRFGNVPQGSLQRRKLTITNSGADPALPPLTVTAIEPTPDTPAFRIEVAAFPLVIPAGESQDVPVIFEPGEIGSHEVTLTLSSNDGSTPTVTVLASGKAFDAPVCQLELTPAALDFGELDPTRGAVLGVRFRNAGPDICVLRDIDIAAGSDPAFRFPSNLIESFVLRSGAWFGRMVAFDPAFTGAGAGDYRGELELFVVEHGTRRRLAVPLSATSHQGCIFPSPRFVDFGTERIDCGIHDAVVRYENDCSADVLVSSIELGTGTTADEFELTGAPATPFLVPGHGRFNVSARWWARTRGPSYTPLFVTEETRPRPLLVPLIADLVSDGEKVDSFTQHAAGVVDVLLVIDNSGSMAEEQARISAAVGVLVDEAVAGGIDFHLGVTTSGLTAIETEPTCPGGAKGGEAGRLFPADGSRDRVVTAATPNGRDVLARNTQVGLCHYLEEGMEAMRLALAEPLVSQEDASWTPLPGDGNAGFLRREAQLGVIFVSEEDDHSGYPVDRYELFLRALKGDNGAIVSAIAATDPGCVGTSGVATRYVDLVTRMGGQAESICEADWSGLLRGIAARSFQPQTSFPLSGTPDDAGLTVTVDGVEVPRSGWVHDPVANAVSFLPGSEPAPGAQIELHYVARCN